MPNLWFYLRNSVDISFIKVLFAPLVANSVWIKTIIGFHLIHINQKVHLKTGSVF